MSVAAQGMDRVPADYMGMMATIMNSVALQSELEKNLLLEVNNFSPDPSEIQLFYEDTDSIIERLSPRMYFEFEDLQLILLAFLL